MAASLLRALERARTLRYRTARDLASDLENFLMASGDAIPTLDVSKWMGQVFPDGTKRIQALQELGAHVGSTIGDELFDSTSSLPPRDELGDPCSGQRRRGWGQREQPGRTPGMFRLMVGRHELQLRGSSGAWRSVTVDVTVGSSTPVSVPLAP
jgi:hypothetical protein